MNPMIKWVETSILIHFCLFPNQLQYTLVGVIQIKEKAKGLQNPQKAIVDQKAIQTIANILLDLLLKKFKLNFCSNLTNRYNEATSECNLVGPIFFQTWALGRQHLLLRFSISYSKILKKLYQSIIHQYICV